ncbi:MAG: alpha/beta hydrolase [Afipia sp.]|nr:alpha/beta hydrolase [Afipia sp.]
MQTGHRNSPAPQSFQRPSLPQGAVQRARRFNPDPASIRRPERYVVVETRGNTSTDEAVLELRRARYALYTCAFLFVATMFGSAAFLYGKLGGGSRLSQQISTAPADDIERNNFSSMSVRAKDGDPEPPRIPDSKVQRNTVAPAEIIARSFGALETRTRQATSTPRADRIASATPQDDIAPRATPRPQAATPPRNSASREAKTVLVDFDNAPFPYNGNMPNSERRFLDRGEGANRGHTNFRGRVLKESEVFNDRRALLHIPQGFDANKPGVIVVFFHGHGANLADDVRDRQQVPAQISASGVNAVMVAPQFAVNAADSSAGKFWEKDGFKRFMDEAAVKFAKLNGDARAAKAFAKMPIVIVAYSGGFGPTLSVLDRGGLNQRIRGIVLLDALYAGMDKFADWIASNRSAFFVSSYTPHTRGRNVELERLLDDRSISYGAELKPNRLPGSVTFLPAGDISHRDFVTHAWADFPIEDVLTRLDGADPKSANTASDQKSMLFVARR